MLLIYEEILVVLPLGVFGSELKLYNLVLLYVFSKGASFTLDLGLFYIFENSISMLFERV